MKYSSKYMYDINNLTTSYFFQPLLSFHFMQHSLYLHLNGWRNFVMALILSSHAVSNFPKQIEATGS